MQKILRGARGAGASLATCVLLAAPAGAQDSCRQALALGLDVSGSVDLDEYRLQLDGLAAALTDPEVASALLTGTHRPVVLAVYEWSDESFQRLLIDWIAITSPEVLAGVAGRLRETPRQPAPQTTAIGAAMLYGAQLIARAPACPKRTIDLSGDGKSNSGPRPQDVRATPALAGIVVNGLTIGSAPADHADPSLAELSAYYKAQVIHGAGAFVMTAETFDGFAEAMARKLLKELEGAPMTGIPGPDTRLAAKP
ncbi:DUF1194 domain-containing protein [Vannielia litorea]|uniref:DUF1194 domain-containing protein n=1 Tax=Vannielia litorea TaxID=1217970 RepID=UPI001FEA9D41|nr:DUF1194 domain-containing protein [Vannielia litorea]